MDLRSVVLAEGYGVTQVHDICQKTVSDLAEKVHQARQTLVARRLFPQGAQTPSTIHWETVSMVTTA